MKKLSFAELKKNESFRLVVVLGAIALASALILSIVYMFTEATIDYEARTLEKISENYAESKVEKSLDISGFQNPTSTEITGAYQAEDGAIIILSKSMKAYKASDGIELIVIIKDDKILSVIKSAANETPGIGAELLKEDYLSKFNGISVDAFDTTNLSKEAAVVPYRTNATYTSTGVHYSVNAAVACYNYLKEVQG